MALVTGDGVTNRINQAWERRYAQKLELCLEDVAVLKRETDVASITVENLGRRVRDGGLPPEIALELLLLRGSLDRWLGKFDSVAATLEQADKFAEEFGLSHFDRLAMEKGLFLFLRGDFLAALDEFLAAAGLARSPGIRCAALVNSAFCLGNLGLPSDSTYFNAMEALKKLDPNSPLYQATAGQLEVVKIRRCFRDGDVAAALSGSREFDTSRVQALYLMAWLEQLPYHTFHVDKLPPWIEELAQRSMGHLSTYRINTLKGLLHPKDFVEPKLSEWVDRLYLWVWQWLANPAEFSVGKIIAMLPVWEGAQSVHRLTSEARKMLANSLLWIGLFDPTCTRHLQSVVSLLHSSHEPAMPLFDLERLFLSYLTALRDGQELLAKEFSLALSKNPIWSSNVFLFKPLFDSLQRESENGVSHLPILSRTLKQVCVPFRSESPIIVDLRTYEIHNRLTDKKIISEPMALAIALLCEHQPVPCDDFVAEVFHFARYDSVSHNPRIFNLISRLKLFLGDRVAIGIKSGSVWWECDSADFAIRRFPVELGLAEQQADWREFLIGKLSDDDNRSGVPSANRNDSVPPRWEGAVTRQELEKLLQRPRSTTNRLLANWVGQGLVRQEGKARSSKYFLVNLERNAE